MTSGKNCFFITNVTKEYTMTLPHTYTYIVRLHLGNEPLCNFLLDFNFEVGNIQTRQLLKKLSIEKDANRQ